MAFIQVEDLYGSIEGLVFSEVFDRHQGLIAPDTIILLEGSISTRDEPPKVIVNSMDRVQNLREKYQAQLQLLLKLETEELTKDDLNQMAALMSLHKGETTVKFQVHTKHEEKPIRMNVRKFVVEPSNDLLTGLRDIIGRESVLLRRNKEKVA